MENISNSSKHAINMSVRGKSFFQPKLTINQPNDFYEQEADAMADKVMRMPINEQPFFSPNRLSISRLQSKCQHYEEEEKLQRKETNSEVTVADATTENYISSLNGRGKSLTQEERRFFEPRFGYDFSDVKFHTDTIAAKSADSINALAYASGNNIIFNENQFSSTSDSGKKLLAHELTHVVQQQSLNQNIQRDEIEENLDSGLLPDGLEEENEQAVNQQSSEEESAITNSQCVTSPGVLNSDCSAYASNSWWLPFAYANNATCACSTTPNSPKYNCIRKFLQDRLASAPTWLKTVAVAAKVNDVPGTPQYSVYEAFVQTTLTPRIYQDHVDAYNSCCCPSGPASYPAWVAVTTVPILPCSLVGWNIKNFGNCEGTSGVW